MEYKYGDLCIKKDKLEDFLKGLPKGKYRTFDILEKYQGKITRNTAVSVGNSWNAYFGKILNQCSENSNGIIRNIEKDKGTIVDNGETTTAEWEIL